jgi:hypothetical protein
MTTATKETDSRAVTALLGRALPLAGLAIAVVVNLAWIGFLGYGLAKLL